MSTVAGIKSFIKNSGAIFGGTTFDSDEVTEPLRLNDKNVIFPAGWTKQQCDQWRQNNDAVWTEADAAARDARKR